MSHFCQYIYAQFVCFFRPSLPKSLHTPNEPDSISSQALFTFDSPGRWSVFAEAAAVWGHRPAAELLLWVDTFTCRGCIHCWPWPCATIQVFAFQLQENSWFMRRENIVGMSCVRSRWWRWWRDGGGGRGGWRFFFVDFFYVLPPQLQIVNGFRRIRCFVLQTCWRTHTWTSIDGWAMMIENAPSQVSRCLF